MKKQYHAVTVLNPLLAALILFFSINITATVYGQDAAVFTWMKGDDLGDPASVGVYGTRGIADPSNFPGGREKTTRWTDSQGKFWLFGGLGRDKKGDLGALNDLWKYDPLTHLWTWIGGSDISIEVGAMNAIDKSGSYGTQGIPDPANIPGERYGSTSWTDGSGDLWLFGGTGPVSSATYSEFMFNDLWKYEPVDNRWTWMKGSDSTGQAGVYGIKGTPDPANNPGARLGSVSWTDGQGNLWLFGGSIRKTGRGQELNDLWKYDPLTNRWTWVGGSDILGQAGVYGTKGTADPANFPGARVGATGWADDHGNLWLFSGSGSDKDGSNGFLNDLWKYDPLTNLWTWVAGSDVKNQSGLYGTMAMADSSSMPGARNYSTSWKDDDGELWLFGGYGLDKNASRRILNDIWKFDPLTSQWTWVGGSDAGWQPGVYGTKGTADPANIPGARQGSISWTDHAGNIFLFAGNGMDGFGSEGQLKDLWKYDPLTNLWTWIGGSDVLTKGGFYGTQGTPATANTPGARYSAISWTDQTGNFWLFGGDGRDKTGIGSLLNDLWKFDPVSDKWTWISGSDVAGQSAEYGIQGTAAPENIPGGRINAGSWIDQSGNLWLFGGIGRDKTGIESFLNDLWKYDPVRNLWTWVGGGDSADQGGVYGTKGTAGQTNIPGARQEPITWTDGSGNLWLFGGHGANNPVTANKMMFNDLWKYEPLDDRWTWVGGSDTTDQTGVYGTKGVPDPANIPGARYGSSSWTDESGNLWLFGGKGPIDTLTSYPRTFNDLWKYEPLNARWTWVGGSDSTDQTGVYGTKGTADPANIPGARDGSVSWTDKEGKFWLFGGNSYDQDQGSDPDLRAVVAFVKAVVAGVSGGFRNDLWKYDPLVNLWTWVGGSKFSYHSGIYGTQGMADSVNIPGARAASMKWIDQTGALWLFGGYGMDKVYNPSSLNDLWRISLTDIVLELGASALTYGVAPASFTVTGNAGLPVTVTSSDPAVFEVASDAATINIKSAGTATLTATINGTTYSASKEITIAKAALTATAENKSKTYGDSNPALTIAYAGFRNNETAAVLDTAPAVTTVATTSSDAGTYAISVSGGSDNNYDLTYVAGTLTINKKAQSITFGKPNEVSETAGTISLSATATSGLAIAFVSADQNKVTIYGNTATIKGPGLATVKATQTGNNNYEAAAEVSQSFCILPVKPVITTSGQGSGNTVLTSSTTGNIQWYKDGQPLSGKTSSELTVEDTGVYSVKCSVDGCATESDAVSMIVTAIGKESEAIRLYPNPAKDELRLVVPPSADGTSLQAEIIDAFGRPVRGQRVNGGEAVFRIEGLAPGNYFIRVTGQKQQVYRRFIKQ